ncbi:AEC family transporter [Pseudodesulfovibrio tunisiensis]|uniref:AEC family transporter n=1 Tax=Pseudodesulfovibrio tunisiensis TaxID=463192 RepID=UPI001FB2B76C|nr:AEC family transporter [Pseudodesulfovibrio tunisiensis]
MLMTVVSTLLPLFLMVLGGWYAQRRGILADGSAAALNDFVYYFALPALIFVSLATTPISEIFQFRFIAGFTLAMFASYILMFLVSAIFFKAHHTESCLRSTSASYPNCAYLGFPIILSLFHGSREAYVASTLAVLVPTLIVMLVVAEFEMHRSENKSLLRIMGNVTLTMLKTPVISCAFLGIAFSLCGLTMPEFLANGLRSFGMASIPCALFAVGMLMCGLESDLKIRNILSVNLVKIVIHPILAAVFLLLFDVSGKMLLMGILLAGMPTAALACVFSQVYNTCESETSATVFLSMLLYVPTFSITLMVADGFGLVVG